jgi:hypothetical protein
MDASLAGAVEGGAAAASAISSFSTISKAEGIRRVPRGPWFFPLLGF